MINPIELVDSLDSAAREKLVAVAHGSLGSSRFVIASDPPRVTPIFR